MIAAPARATRAARPVVAFFDVDETVISEKSMIAFWRHWLAMHPSADATEADALLAEAAATRDREALNRRYYRRYAGVSLTTLEAAGRLWYESYRCGSTAFVRPALDAVEQHRAAGHEVVLVSGSMRPLLAPLAEELGVSAVLCTELMTGADGVLTGEVHRPMIGGAKAEAARAVMCERGADPDDCFAYGDHESDLDLLFAVGRPVVVGDSPRLKREARRSGWPVRPALRGPLRTLST
ncbi:HAD family phosphatase [Streptomyces sp. WAC 04229]|uniref:HAD family hydrolase n=1 Tax=Streptomyces sp. WAC 04229 TaxID=2203206 RepID=UPI000F736F75|nr:HAD-IB family hydrolase [Streptomyces sp. WAC 04229]